MDGCVASWRPMGGGGGRIGGEGREAGLTLRREEGRPVGPGPRGRCRVRPEASIGTYTRHHSAFCPYTTIIVYIKLRYCVLGFPFALHRLLFSPNNADRSPSPRSLPLYPPVPPIRLLPASLPSTPPPYISPSIFPLPPRRPPFFLSFFLPPAHAWSR